MWVSWTSVGLLLALPGCVSARARSDYAELVRAADVGAPRSPTAAPAAADLGALAHEARLDVILRIAQAENPDVAEARERVRADAERVLASGRLPDAELKYEQWGVPLSRPYALGSADMLMLGVRQTLPAHGVRAAAAQEAAAQAALGLATQRTRQLDLSRDVARAFFDYYVADREHQLHLEHAELMRQLIELAKAKYETGRGSQADVLRGIVALTAVHNDLANIDVRRSGSRALLNTLMGRDPDAALGPPRELTPADLKLDLPALERDLDRERPELAGARTVIQRDRAVLAGARSAARWPTFMLGADYMFSPRDRMSGYGAMVSMTLPWLSARHDDEVRQAEHTITADQRAFEAARNTARYQVRDAMLRYRAAQATFSLIDHELAEQARQSLKAAESSYGTGQGDSLAVLDAARSYLDVRIGRLRALAQVQSSLADLERAVGRSIQGARP